MGGYEGADHVNAQGQALDMARASGHLDRLDEDYRRAKRLGLRTLRESIGWRLSEAPGGTLDLRRVHRIAHAARRAGVQPLWTLMHYGVPGDLSLFDDALIERFARFAAAVARTLRPRMPGPRVYTPINEISFLAWAATSGGLLRDPGAPEALAGRDAASTEHSGYEVKRRLARAALAGMAAIRAEDPEARFLHVEPLVHVAPPLDRPELAPLAQQIRDYQWQTLDLLCGRQEPALGGHPQALDCLGFNHYHSSQWEAHSEARLAWHLRDPRRLPLHVLLHEAWQRYGRPLALAETGHVGMGRAAWLHEMAGEARRALALGVPLDGVCLYPLLDRPDWQDGTRWHRCGLWHVDDAAAGRTRHLVQACAVALRDWQRPDAPRERRLLVLLPTRWERLEAGLQQLLRRLAASFEVLGVEPPGPSTGPAEVRRHALGPALSLLMLHGLGPGGWAPHAERALAGLRAALGPGPAGGTVVWLMQAPEGAGMVHRARVVFRGAALVWQPARQAPVALPAGFAPGDLILCESPARRRAWAARHPLAIPLPRGLPADLLRPPPAGSYEAQEAERLLGPRTGPRLLLPAADDAAADPALLQALADRLAQALPGCRLYRLGPPGTAPEPAQIVALGELAPELLPGLLWACDAALVPANDRPALLALARAAGLPVMRLPALTAQDLTQQDLTPALLALIARRIGSRAAAERRARGAWQRHRAAHTRAYYRAEARLLTALADLRAPASTSATPSPAALTPLPPPRPWPDGP